MKCLVEVPAVNVDGDSKDGEDGEDGKPGSTSRTQPDGSNRSS